MVTIQAVDPVYAHDCTALRTSPSSSFKFKEIFNSFIPYYLKVFQEACPVFCLVSLVELLKTLAWVNTTFVAEA